MKAIIIDDEKKARNVLHILVTENCKKITEIYEASDLLSGVELIKKHKPQIVFLDIEMPNHSGLDIVNFINKDEFNFEIIFTTAYSEFAVQAFQLSAIDYILKPIRPAKLVQAVEKAVEHLGRLKINERLTELKNSLNVSEFKKIGLPNVNGIKFVNIKDIICFEADGMYTKVFTINNNPILVSKPLKFFTEILSKIPNFYKPHRSFLINLVHLQEYVKTDGGYMIMDNGVNISISKDKRNEFLEIVQNIG